MMKIPYKFKINVIDITEQKNCLKFFFMIPMIEFFAVEEDIFFILK